MHLGEPAHVVKRRSLDQQLRIHLVYDSGLSDLLQEKETLVKVTIIFRTLELFMIGLNIRDCWHLRNDTDSRKCLDWQNIDSSFQLYF